MADFLPLNERFVECRPRSRSPRALAARFEARDVEPFAMAGASLVPKRRLLRLAAVEGEKRLERKLVDRRRLGWRCGRRRRLVAKALHNEHRVLRLAAAVEIANIAARAPMAVVAVLGGPRRHAEVENGAKS